MVLLATVNTQYVAFLCFRTIKLCKNGKQKNYKRQNVYFLV